MISNSNTMNSVLGAYTEGGCTANPMPFPQNTPVAMAYVPFQQIGQIYTPESGLERGTIFPDLDKPFLGGGTGK